MTNIFLINKKRKRLKDYIYYTYNDSEIRFNERTNLGLHNIVYEKNKLYFHHSINPIKVNTIKIIGKNIIQVTQKVKKINLNEPIFPMVRSWEGNFHHLVKDCLPLFCLYLELKKKIKNLKLVISNKGLYNFKKETFKLFGIKDDEIITINFLNKKLKTIISSPLIITTDIIRKNKNKFMNLVYNKFKIPINLKEKPKRIIIARSSIDKCNYERNCINSYELYIKLRDELNFKILLMPNYNLKERVEILNNTEYLISELGANCDNIFLMTPVNLKKVLIIGNKSIGRWKFKYTPVLKPKNINLEYIYNGIQNNMKTNWRYSTWYIPNINEMFNKIKDDLQ